MSMYKRFLLVQLSLSNKRRGGQTPANHLAVHTVRRFFSSSSEQRYNHHPLSSEEQTVAAAAAENHFLFSLLFFLYKHVRDKRAVWLVTIGYCRELFGSRRVIPTKRNGEPLECHHDRRKEEEENNSFVSVSRYYASHDHFTFLE